MIQKMKYIVLIPDGASDETYEEIGGKTPLEAARTPNMDFMAKHGRVGFNNPIPSGMEPGSDVGHLSIFGYNPKKHYCGRAPLEAASMGVELGPDEVAFRMNLVTESDGIMIDHSAGAISTKEARALIKFLSSKLSSEYVKFYPGVSYRHIAVLKDAKGLEGFKARCTPPHDILEQKWENYLPDGAGDSFLIKLIEDSKPLLEKHEINQVRIDLGENPANMIWFWGQGTNPSLELFEKRFGVKGSVISAVDLIQGLGKCIGLEALKVPGMTGTLDTNYEGKVEAAIDSLKEKDFVLLHTEASDEATHEGNLKSKILAIEHFDQRVVGPIRKFCEENRETRVMIAIDHNCFIRTRTHSGGKTPFLIYGNGILSNGADRFTEIAAYTTNLQVKEGDKLMGMLFQG